jgi:transposase
MQLKTILNRIQKHPSFVYKDARLVEDAEGLRIEVDIEPRANGRPVCSRCGKRRPGYDRLPVRSFEFVPLWGIAVFFLYRMRRVNCPDCGIVVESVPWADGKHQITMTYMWFLARWAKKLSWTDVANTFNTSWSTVFRAVEFAVEWGRAHVNLENIKSIGIDEISWKKGHKNFLTLVYQIDEGFRRLLWVGEHRKAKTLMKFFRWFGAERTANLKFICSDMWQPYLKVIAYKAKSAVHVLDRFHIMSNMNKAIEKVRRQETSRLKHDGYEPVLTGSRWCILKRPENLTEKQEAKLADLLQYNLRTVRSYLLKEDFEPFWYYVSPTWAGKFLDRWCTRVMYSRIEPMKKFARSMRTHRELILNWFRAKGAISSGTVEGLNAKAKLTTRKAYGFSSYKMIEIALFHTLGDLPEPEVTHTF